MNDAICYIIMKLLFAAIESKHVEEAKSLISEVQNVNLLDTYGYSALHLSSFNGLTEVGIFLLEKGIDPNIQDKNGQTILHYCALYNQSELAKHALQKGAALSIQDVHGNQPLWTAVFNDKGRNDRIEIITMYLNAGADIDHKNKAGKSPKDIIIIAGYDNLKPLIKEGT